MKRKLEASFGWSRGLTLIEVLAIIAIIGLLSSYLIARQKDARDRANNAKIATTLDSVSDAVFAEFAPGQFDGVCEYFDTDGEWERHKNSIVNAGGEFTCTDATSTFRIGAKLNEDVILTNNFVRRAYAHHFGGYYCVNSLVEKNFTHWPTNDLEYPYCTDDRYMGGGTGSGSGSSSGSGSTGSGGGDGDKQDICHFGNTINVSDNAVKAHLKHGDTLGAC